MANRHNEGIVALVNIQLAHQARVRVSSLAGIYSSGPWQRCHLLLYLPDRNYVGTSTVALARGGGFMLSDNKNFRAIYLSHAGLASDHLHYFSITGEPLCINRQLTRIAYHKLHFGKRLLHRYFQNHDWQVLYLSTPISDWRVV